MEDKTEINKYKLNLSQYYDIEIFMHLKIIFNVRVD